MPWMQRQQGRGKDIVRGDVIELTDDGQKQVVVVLGVSTWEDDPEVTLDGYVVAVDGAVAYKPILTTVDPDEPVEIIAHQDPWDWSADYARRAAAQ